MNLVARAMIALLLFVGFYVLAFGVVLGLLSIAYLQSAYAPNGVDVAGMFGVVAAFIVGWAVFPRWQRVERSVGIERVHCPKLFELLEAVCAKIGRKPPDVLHLTMDANAFASEESRCLGWGRRSHVGLGLPLLAVLTRRELESVLAHELGHHIASDVRFGPWVHSTRRALGRTIDNLDGSSYLLHLPFVLYARLFLRVTASISREQEYRADRVAAETVGDEPTASALYRLEDAVNAYSAYFRFEVAPLLDRGYLPPLLEGFQRFLAVDRFRSTVKRAIDEHRLEPTSPTDTHPSTAERLLALGFTAAYRPGPRSDCLDLLEDPRKLEERVLRESLVNGESLVLKPLEWEDVTKIYLDGNAAVTYRQRLFPLLEQGVETLTEERHKLSEVADELYADYPLLSPLARQRKLMEQLPVALALVLTERGFPSSYVPGVGPVFQVGEGEVRPAFLVDELDQGRLTKEQWRSLWTEILAAGQPVS